MSRGVTWIIRVFNKISPISHKQFTALPAFKGLQGGASGRPDLPVYIRCGFPVIWHRVL
jgi:hypothetical protein